jgi:eukaryotic-like serine/threonine-protein kinase
MPVLESRQFAAVAQPLDDNDLNLDPLIGPLLAERYRLSSLIGEGGMGRVYLGEHALMRKRVAVKVLHKELTQVPEVVARFEREAMAAANIEHPNVAAATDFGKLPDGSVFLVLEYVEGRGLRHLIEQGPVPVGRAIHIARQIASAVAAAHALGIVHRDLKPENVLLVEKNGDCDFVKVLDFGIAKVPVQEVSDRGSIRPGKVITRVGMIFGTPEYMAPEQALGQNVDARADMYTMGVILFEMLCGKRPFCAESNVGILGQQLQGPLPSFAQRAPEVRVPTMLEQVIQRLLAPTTSARMASAVTLVAALDGVESMLNPMGEDSQGRLPLPSGLDGSGDSLNGYLPKSEALLAAWRSGAAKELDDAATNASTLPAPTYDESRTSPQFDKRQAAKPVGNKHRGLARNRAILWGLAGILPAVLVALAWIGLHTTSKAEAPAQPSVSAISAAPKPVEPAPVAKTASENQLAEASAAGLTSLRLLAADFPKDGRVLVELAKAQFAIGNAGDCLESIKSAYIADASINKDANLATLLWKMAQKRETSDRTLQLLESGFGERGVDILYDLTTTSAVRREVRLTASKSLYSVKAQDTASPALRVLLALQHAVKCEEKLAILPSVERDGDARILPMLTLMHSTAGCGSRNRQDCYTCLRRGLELENAIAAVKRRAR